MWVLYYSKPDKDVHNFFAIMIATIIVAIMNALECRTLATTCMHESCASIASLSYCVSLNENMDFVRVGNV